MAARWTDSPQDNEESKHRAVTPSCEVGLWMECVLVLLLTLRIQIRADKLKEQIVRIASAFARSLVKQLFLTQWSGKTQAFVFSRSSLSVACGCNFISAV